MKNKSRQFQGLSVSPGIGIGSAHLVQLETIKIPKFWISEREVSSEIARFRSAVRDTQRELTHIRNRLCKFEVGEQISIIDSHLMIAQDETLLEGTQRAIKTERINAEWAFQREVDKLIQKRPADVTPYFEERYKEIQQVSDKVLKHMLGQEHVQKRPIQKHSVIIAHDLSPTDTVQLVKGVTEGFVTEAGGPTSHTAIVARALEIPGVCGVEGITHLIREGDVLLVDGDHGRVFLNPSNADIKKYRAIKKKHERDEHRLLRQAHLPAMTRDGYRLRLAANMELLEEVPTIKSHGGEGVGLFRTELLFLTQNRIPSEDDQFNIYSKVVSQLAPQETTIRTLDIGGEKMMEDITFEESSNPALGLRAIRFCLKEKTILRNQLRALLRASAFGPLKILIPMVTNVDEIRQVKKIILEIQKELKSKNISFDPKTKLGAMVEIPSAALMASEIASEVDFLSIGTNDLIQYTLAVDRVNEEVSYLYEPLHPAVLRLLNITCDAGRDQRIDVSLCGEMAGDPVCFMILLGLGLTELSMNPFSIPKVKQLARSVSFRKAKDLLDKALTMKTANEVESLVRKVNAKLPNFPQS